MKNLVKYFIAGSMIAVPSTANSLFMEMAPMRRGGNVVDSIMIIGTDSYNPKEWLTSDIFLSESLTERRYDVRIKPQDTWESLTKDIRCYEPKITIDKLVTQSFSFERNPLILNLVPGERLFYFAIR